MTSWRTLSRAEFDAWHAAYKQAHGFPLPGRNAATGELVPAPTGVTTDYTTPTDVGTADSRFTIMFDGLEGDLPGAPAADPSWFFDTSLEQLWVDADQWALVSAESQQAFKDYPDPLTCLGEPVDVVRDNIDHVVWAAKAVTEDHLLALGVILP